MKQPVATRWALRSGTISTEKSSILTGTGSVPPAEVLVRRRIESIIPAAGWRFSFCGQSVETTISGFDQPKAVLKTPQHLVTASQQERCNALERDRASKRSHWSAPYIRLSADPRDITQRLIPGRDA